MTIHSLTDTTIADRAIATMRSPKDMHIICVDVTNRCDLRCSNCTRLLANQKRHWDMTADNFRTALRSLSDYPGVIAMIGGNPCLHKSFADLCRIFVEEIPNKRQRGLWSNNVFEHQELIRDTFGFFNLNPHNDRRGRKSLEKLKQHIPGIQFYEGHSRHAPLLTAVRDLIQDEQQMWDTIVGCDINRNWSATIVENKGALRAYFCEVAASFDLARGTDHGAPVEPGWWHRTIADFPDQVKRFCPGCGVPARLAGQIDKDEVDSYSDSNADIALATRGKRKTVRVASMAEAEPTTRPVTDYTDQHGAPKVPDASPAIRVSVVIPCYNAADTIAETIASAVIQRVPGEIDVEILVADDGSTDRSTAVVGTLQGRHPGVVRFLPTVGGNTGAAAARNRGLKQATGKYICFLDADDCYAPDFFKAAVGFLEKQPTFAAVATDVEVFDSHREVSPLHLQAMAACLPSNILLRRSIVDAIGGFPEHKAYRGAAAGEDVAFRQAVLRHFSVSHLQGPFLRYRAKRGSHFDLFLDSSDVVDGALVPTSATPEQSDGSMTAANADYARSVSERLGDVGHAQRPILDTAINFDALVQYENFRLELGGRSDIPPLAAFALRMLAERGPSRGYIAVPERIGQTVPAVLDVGTKSVGRLGVLHIEQIPPDGERPVLRLIVVDASGTDRQWVGDVARAVPCLNQEGCVAFFMRPERGNLDEILAALRSIGATWREIPWTARIAVFQRTV